MTESFINLTPTRAMRSTVWSACALAILVIFAGYNPCEAQQIPRRIDTSNYQNAGPQAPRLTPDRDLAIGSGISETGKRVKVYRKPSDVQIGTAPPPSLPGPPSWTTGTDAPPPSLQGRPGWYSRGRQSYRAPSSSLQGNSQWTTSGGQLQNAPSPSLRRTGRPPVPAHEQVRPTCP